MQVDPLEAAKAALQAGQRANALDHLLEAWADSRAPSIADAIDLLSKDIDRTLFSIADERIRSFDQAWHTIADLRRAADMSRLLFDFDRPPAALVLERVRHLETRPHDPRTADALMRLFEAGSFRTGPGKKIWTALFKMLTRIGDPRIEKRLRAYRPEDSSFGNTVRKRTSALLQTLEKPRPLSDQETSALVAINTMCNAALKRPPATESEIFDGWSAPSQGQASGDKSALQLLSAIYEAPDDDTPRQIYADWLLERGDVRGEFIALQLQRHQGRPQAKRERALLREHVRSWLGALEPVIDPRFAVFERGFLWRCRVRFKTEAQRKLIGLRDWGTVGRIDAPFELLVDSCLQALRAVERVGAPTAMRLMSHPKKFPWTSLDLRVQSEWTHAQQSAISACCSMPKLGALRLHYDDGVTDVPDGPESLQWLFQGPLKQQLKTLTLAQSYYRQTANIRIGQLLTSEFHTLEQLCIEAAPDETLRRLRFIRAGSRWALRIELCTNQWRWRLEDLTFQLKSVPKKALIKEVSVVGDVKRSPGPMALLKRIIKSAGLRLIPDAVEQRA